MKNVLIITYYWPPSGGAGVQRWLKFTKYLPEFGWRPVILTVDPAYATYPQRDESLKAEINSECLVFTCKSFEFYNLYKRLSGKKEVPYGGFANASDEGLMLEVSKFIRGNFFLPDPRKGWNKYAVQKAGELIRNFGIETVITTGPPHSTQLIGLKLKKKYKINWIADFRDPWTDLYYYTEFKQTALARKIDEAYERMVIENSDLIITVSESFKRLLATKSRHNLSQKIHVVPNGFDQEDFYARRLSKESEFTITYIGTISAIYQIDGFIGALTRLDEGEKERLKIRVVGKMAASLADKFDISGIKTEFVGYVEHSKSIDFLLQSSLLLLIIPKVKNNEGIVPGKFFEYLASGKPVLALGPSNSDLARLIRETRSGRLLEYDDSEHIASYISSQLKSPALIADQEAIRRYSRKLLTREIAELLLG
jgi:glycosyltransferase involved in cell wall biosynthesis